MTTTTNPSELRVGPLAGYVEPGAEPTATAVLPCERRHPCTDPRPILSLEVFDLRMKLPRRFGLPRSAPRFGIFDPNDPRGACFYHPGSGLLETGNWQGPSTFTRRGRNVLPWTFLGMVFGGFAGLLAFCLANPAVRPLPTTIFVTLMSTAMAGIAGFIISTSNEGPWHRLMARYSGPVPEPIRQKIRRMSRPYIVAPVTEWAKDPRPRLECEPYLVEHCRQGGTHLHVEAWWDLEKAEMVIGEFIVPGPPPRDIAPNDRRLGYSAGLDFAQLNDLIR